MTRSDASQHSAAGYSAAHPAIAASQTTPAHAAAQSPAGSQSAASIVSGELGKAWDWTKQQAASGAAAVGAFDAAHGHVLTRAAGAAQAIGGGAEALARYALAGGGAAATATGVGAAPGIPAVAGGVALGANGADNVVAGVRTALSGEFHHTFISQAAGAGAHALGASDATAATVTNGVDLAQGVVGAGASVVVGRLATKGAAATGEIATAQSTTATTAAEAAKAAKPTGDYYSVAFETKLSPTSYPGASRGAHFQEANQSLLHATEGDAEFAKSMQDLGVNVQKTPTGLAPRSSPANWTWHHAQEPGVMQLVPRSQHAPGSAFQDALHPNGIGGYAIWGKQ